MCKRISQSWRSSIGLTCSSWVQQSESSLKDSQEKSGLSVHQQILCLLGTWLYTDDKGFSYRKMGLHTTYGLVRATLQAAVPPCTQSVSAMMCFDQV
jgi:hypothetical protein